MLLPSVFVASISFFWEKKKKKQNPLKTHLWRFFLFEALRLKEVRDVFPSKATFVLLHKRWFLSLALNTRLRQHLQKGVKHLQIGCNKLIKQHCLNDKRMNNKTRKSQGRVDKATEQRKTCVNTNNTCKNNVVFLHYDLFPCYDCIWTWLYVVSLKWNEVWLITDSLYSAHLPWFLVVHRLICVLLLP